MDFDIKKEDNQSVESKANTGIKTSLESFEALIFDDDTCPKCGEHSLVLDSVKGYEDKDILVRYRCINCGYVCPLSREHVTVGIEAEFRPGYDSAIKNFMKRYHSKEKYVDYEYKQSYYVHDGDTE